MNIGDNIKKIRKEKGLKQTDFATQLNISQSYLSDLENGRKNISIDTAKQIADKLNVTIGYLTSGNKMYSDLTDDEKKNEILKFKNMSSSENTSREETLKNNLLELIKSDLQYLDIHYLNNVYNFYELEKNNKNTLLFISVLLQKLFNDKGSESTEVYDDIMNEFSEFLKEYLNIK
ncbi:helix-turn-helix domain-containing protein [Staphylococcus sp. IPLA37010]|uniref:Helix-turn-helix transcriptional regulator n=1 Tax=Staphylococcus equorum TaxID=246432 RepID=A0AAW7AN42_9STAP|nr:helix-turn-helix transcriptional regulator [Staphylococcus equorum]MDK9866735.1 helix-turn-helix transcriptional regulator [Staphylococcus equorum]